MVWSLKTRTHPFAIISDLVVWIAPNSLRHLLNPRQTLICLAGSNRWLQTKSVLQIMTICTKTFSVRAALHSIRVCEIWKGVSTILWRSCEWLTTTKKTLRIVHSCKIEKTMSFSKSIMKTLNNSSGYSKNCPSSKKKLNCKPRQRHTSNNEPVSFLTSLQRL